MCKATERKDPGVAGFEVILARLEAVLDAFCRPGYGHPPRPGCDEATVSKLDDGLFAHVCNMVEAACADAAADEMLALQHMGPIQKRVIPLFPRLRFAFWDKTHAARRTADAIGRLGKWVMP